MRATLRRRARRLLVTTALMTVAAPAGAEVFTVLGLVTVSTAGEPAGGVVAVSNGGVADGHVAVSNGGESRGFVASIAHDGPAHPGGFILGSGPVTFTAVSTTGRADGTVSVSGTGDAGSCGTGQAAVSVTGNACSRTANVSVLGDAGGGIVNVDL